MRYIMPDWDDRLDVGYCFATDAFSKEHLERRRDADKFVHEFVKPAPYDGMLISLATFGKKTPRKKDRKHPWELDGAESIRDYYRLPKAMEIMGDCGAFTYVAESKPPKEYSPSAVAKAYDELGVDYGFSVDHLAVPFVKRVQQDGSTKLAPLSETTQRNRVKLSLENARKFLRACRRKKYEFTPIGVAQGLNPKNYATSAATLVDYGYDYIALGGLVQYSTPELLKIVAAVRQAAPDVKLHLLGVLRPTALDTLRVANVTSFDSASYLRKAWLRSGQNYVTKTGAWYAAIRVPQVDHHEQELKNAEYSIEKLRELEQAALTALRDFDVGTASLNACLSTVMQYDQLLFRESETDVEKLKAAYRRTLEAAPWKTCECPICKDLKVEVVIFRGLNRNKRRGFHNSWVFRHHHLNNPTRDEEAQTAEKPITRQSRRTRERTI